MNTLPVRMMMMMVKKETSDPYFRHLLRKMDLCDEIWVNPIYDFNKDDCFWHLDETVFSVSKGSFKVEAYSSGYMNNILKLKSIKMFHEFYPDQLDLIDGLNEGDVILAVGSKYDAIENSIFVDLIHNDTELYALRGNENPALDYIEGYNNWFTYNITNIETGEKVWDGTLFEGDDVKGSVREAFCDLMDDFDRFVEERVDLNKSYEDLER